MVVVGKASCRLHSHQISGTDEAPVLDTVRIRVYELLDVFSRLAFARRRIKRHRAVVERGSPDA